MEMAPQDATVEHEELQDATRRQRREGWFWRVVAVVLAGAASGCVLWMASLQAPPWLYPLVSLLGLFELLIATLVITLIRWLRRLSVMQVQLMEGQSVCLETQHLILTGERPVVLSIRLPEGVDPSQVIRLVSKETHH